MRYTLTTSALLAGARLRTDFVRIGLACGLPVFAITAITDFFRALHAASPAAMLPALLIPAPLGGLAFGICFPLIMRFVMLPMNVRRLHANNSPLYGEMHLAADETGMEFRTAVSTARFPWHMLRRLRESRDVFVVDATKSLFFVIPKDVMTDDAEASLRALWAERGGNPDRADEERAERVV